VSDWCCGCVTIHQALLTFGCQGSILKHEWVGMGDNGFPVLEGKVNNVAGEFFEIW